MKMMMKRMKMMTKIWTMICSIVTYQIEISGLTKEKTTRMSLVFLQLMKKRKKMRTWIMEKNMMVL